MYLMAELSRRLYRWSRSNVRLKRRLRRLQHELADLPRTGLGVRLKDIDPKLESHIARLRQHNRELVIGDFDQDGGILPLFGEMEGVPSIDPAKFLPRTGCPVRLVDLDGRMGVRKEFRSVGRFVQELEALLHLEIRACPVPQLMNVDWRAKSITTTFVPGDVVRELLAVAGADVRDRDSKGPYSRTRDKARIRNGRELVPAIMSASDVGRVASRLKAIHSAGFVLEDVKFGNIILEKASGEPIFLDLERALPTASLPRWLADYLRQIDLRKFHEQFGSSPEEEHSWT
jgi:hypothetical protein